MLGVWQRKGEVDCIEECFYVDLGLWDFVFFDCRGVLDVKENEVQIVEIWLFVFF